MSSSISTPQRLPNPGLSDGEMTSIEIEGVAILVCRLEGRYHAVRDLCSHAEQPLSEGRMRGHTVYCPLHGARFDLRTGACLALPATKDLETYAIEEDGDQIVVTPSTPGS